MSPPRYAGARRRPQQDDDTDEREMKALQVSPATTGVRESKTLLFHAWWQAGFSLQQLRQQMGMAILGPLRRPEQTPTSQVLGDQQPSAVEHPP